MTAARLVTARLVGGPRDGTFLWTHAVELYVPGHPGGYYRRGEPVVPEGLCECPFEWAPGPARRPHAWRPRTVGHEQLVRSIR